MNVLTVGIEMKRHTAAVKGVQQGTEPGCLMFGLMGVFTVCLRHQDVS